jgi:hypothetical protein
MKESVRLDLIKLVYRPDRHPNDCIEAAKIFEDYILNFPEESSEREVEKSGPKKTGISKSKNIGKSDQDLFG